MLREWNAGINRMNKAMGEFLTAHGRVELTMILLLMLIRDEDYEWLFDEMSARTFGKKIEFFKEYTSDDDQFTPENLILRDQIYKDLDDLLPQRNSIVHGETYEYQFGGRPKQPYRLGVKDTLRIFPWISMDPTSLPSEGLRTQRRLAIASGATSTKSEA
jgi:hypothetical protein